MGTTRTLTTEEDLFGMPDDGFRYELVVQRFCIDG